MKFTVDGAVFEKFPELNIGVVAVKNIDNSGTSSEIIKALREEEERIRQNFDTQTLSQNPKIDCWRKAYSAFGAKPRDHLSSVENLYRFVIKGEDIRHINKLVDIYNLVSLKYMVPLGGEDMDKIKGDIKLAFAGQSEPAVLLLGERDMRPPHEGEVIYKDDISAICRRFNWKEVERTKLTEETKNAVLVSEGLLPTTKKDIENISDELKSTVQKQCGGKISVFILNKDNPKFSI